MENMEVRIPDIRKCLILCTEAVTLNDKATMIILAKTVKKVIVNANKNIV
jgi:hypothetical protein